MPPDRSTEQRMAALAKANAVRSAHAEVKRLVRGGYLGAEEVIEHPPQYCDTLPVVRLLRSAPGFGGVAVRRVLRDAGVAETKKVGGLTDRQRRRLAEEVRLGSRTQGPAFPPPRR